MSKAQSHIISKVLSPALQLWLRSQVDHIEELEIKISGGDRQILRGYIPSVFFTSTRAIYQGLHLAQVEITGENIRINLGQVIKGKPLRLLEPVLISGKALVEEKDVKASFGSPLLTSALTDFLSILLEACEIPNPTQILEKYQISWQEVEFNTEKFILKGTLKDFEAKITPLFIRSGLALSNPQTLRLHPLQIEAVPKSFNVSLKELEIDLGSDVHLEELTLSLTQLSCCGRFKVFL